MAWDKDKPAGSQKLRLADDDIRANNAAIDAVFNAMLVAGTALSVTAVDLNGFFTAGNIMLWGNNSAPTGWTRKADWEDTAMICYAASGNIGSGGAASPQDAHVHAGGDHTLTEAEIPSHRHRYNDTVALDGSSSGGHSYPMMDSQDLTTGSFYVGYTGGGGSHSHGDTDANDAPYYQEVIAAEKD